MSSFLRLYLFIFAAALTSAGCFIVRPIAGADIDIPQLQKAREARMMQVRLEGARKLADRLVKGDSVDNADMTFTFSEALLNKAAAQLDSSSGWLDSLTSYSIRSVRVKLYNGSAIATIAMTAYHHGYNVKVDLLMDCILSFGVEQGVFNATLEPFNVVPNVKASGLIAAVEGIIRDIITMKLSTLADNIPPIRFPVDFQNTFPVQTNSVRIRSGVNLDITTPPQSLTYSLSLKEVLCFREKLFIAMNLKSVGVKQ